MNKHEARAQWAQDAARFAALGVTFDGVKSYIPEGAKANLALALDAAPGLVATVPNSAVPAYLTTYIDPAVVEVLFSPTKAAEILGENKKGSWTDETVMFTLVEHTGEVSSYGDYVSNGRAGVNTNWPQRQAYRFQVVKEYGDLELERAGLAKLDYASAIDKAAANTMNRFFNLSYLFGIAGLANYGLTNDPSLSAAVNPAAKAAAGNPTSWFAAGSPAATANEVYNDVLALYTKLVDQTGGLVDRDTPMVLVLPPNCEVAFGFVNTYGLIARDMISKEFPNLEVVTCVQYGAKTAANPNGQAGGNMMQLIAKSIEGQETGYCSFSEKSRTFPMVRELSSLKQKQAAATFGAVLLMPMAVATMVGI